MAKNTNPNKVIIPCRFSFLHCWEPDSVNGSEPKYSVSAIIPKSDTATVNKIKAAIENAKKESLSKWGGKVPPNLKLPLRDGDIDRPDDEAYAGCYFLNANSRQAPQVVDRHVQPILDQSEVYSGCYGQISVTFYTVYIQIFRACPLAANQRCRNRPLMPLRWSEDRSSRKCRSRQDRRRHHTLPGTTAPFHSPTTWHRSMQYSRSWHGCKAHLSYQHIDPTAYTAVLSFWFCVSHSI